MRHKHRATRVMAAALVAAAAVTGTSSAAAKRLPITPKVGRPSTAFVIKFVARYPTSEGQGNAGQFYYYEGHGPGACRDFGLGEMSPKYSPGDRVKLRLMPWSIGENSDRTTWCPGHYSGKVSWLQTDEHGNVQKQHLVGRFIFTVKR
jgi:hypothetical protein